MSSDSKGQGNINFLQAMFQEADAYQSLNFIEAHVEKGVSLHHLPIQPLYMALRQLPPEEAATYIPKLSSEQRTLILDLDLWEKDGLDVDNFEHWIPVFSKIEDEQIRYEFAGSSEFGLFLKGRFNIWTFDVEDPLYPDHDNYFLTDDNLLLFEFDENFTYANEIRFLVRNLYADVGVEKAYAHIMKFISEDFMTIMEEEYHIKKGKLSEAGFVDYYDALDIDALFPNLAVMDNFIRKKKESTSSIDNFGKLQVLHKSVLSPYKKTASIIEEELEKVKDEKRRDYLRFNFLRWVNGTMTLHAPLKEGSVALARLGERNMAHFQLGLNYISDQEFSLPEGQSLFESFDFLDIYRVGSTLFGQIQKGLKKGLREAKIEENEGFLGAYWGEYLDHSFSSPVQLERIAGEKPESIITVEDYQLWKKRSETIIALFPFIAKFEENVRMLSENGQITDEYYLNYNVNEIDFESIILSQLANFCLGHFFGDQEKKMGLTINEFRKFALMALNDEGRIGQNSEFLEKREEFITSFGLGNIPYFSDYLDELLRKHIEGYDFSHLEEKDFAHVGGPILLNAQ
jgi:hypothetical protein